MLPGKLQTTFRIVTAICTHLSIMSAQLRQRVLPLTTPLPQIDGSPLRSAAQILLLVLLVCLLSVPLPALELW